MRVEISKAQFVALQGTDTKTEVSYFIVTDKAPVLSIPKEVKPVIIAPKANDNTMVILSTKNEIGTYKGVIGIAAQHIADFLKVPATRGACKLHLKTVMGTAMKSQTPSALIGVLLTAGDISYIKNK